MSDKRPTAVLRDGCLAASIWERNGKHGRYFEFTLSRSYRAGDGFKYSTTFHERDADALKSVIDGAAQGIREQSGSGENPVAETARTDLGSGADEPLASTGPTDSEEEAREFQAPNDEVAA